MWVKSCSAAASDLGGKNSEEQVEGGAGSMSRMGMRQPFIRIHGWGVGGGVWECAGRWSSVCGGGGVGVGGGGWGGGWGGGGMGGLWGGGGGVIPKCGGGMGEWEWGIGGWLGVEGKNKKRPGRSAGS